MTTARMTPDEAAAALARLPDRDALMERLRAAFERAERQSEPVALVVLDLNRSTFSRAALDPGESDRLTATVADHLRLFTRHSDTLAYLGSDLFALVMEQAHDTGKVLGLTQRLLRLFDGQWQFADHDLHLNPAVGIALYPENGRQVDELFAQAVSAAQEAARTGMRHPRLADPTMRAAVERRLELEAELHRAVERRGFQLYYQPQVNAATGRVSGFEALVRWPHPELGLVPPEEFIPLAEEMGLVVRIGAWVIEEAARQLASWADQGHLGLYVAVNLDAEQLASEGLLDLVDAVLDEHDLAPGQLGVEITERTAIADARVTAAVLHELHRRGVHLALDDFGTGFSSLSMLLDYPFDMLKIDRSFVKRVFDGEKARALTSATVLLAHAARMTVVVEGVETREQLRLVRELGADEIQGFFISRPLPAEECEPFLTGLCDVNVDPEDQPGACHSPRDQK